MRSNSIPRNQRRSKWLLEFVRSGAGGRNGSSKTDIHSFPGTFVDMEWTFYENKSWRCDFQFRPQPSHRCSPQAWAWTQMAPKLSILHFYFLRNRRCLEVGWTKNNRRGITLHQSPRSDFSDHLSAAVRPPLTSLHLVIVRAHNHEGTQSFLKGPNGDPIFFGGTQLRTQMT